MSNSDEPANEIEEIIQTFRMMNKAKGINPKSSENLCDLIQEIAKSIMEKDPASAEDMYSGIVMALHDWTCYIEESKGTQREFVEYAAAKRLQETFADIQEVAEPEAEFALAPIKLHEA